MAKRDHYDILGLSRSASEDDIRKAYRALARKLHPDVNKSPDAAKKFAEVQEAYDTLSDASRRKQYDQFGFAGESSAPKWSTTPGASLNVEDLDEMFDAFFGGRGPGGMGGPFAEAGRARRAQPRPTPPKQPTTVERDLDVPFMTMVRGGAETVRIVQGNQTKTVEVKVPRAIAHGSRLRVPVGSDVELILRVVVGSHPLFRRGFDDPIAPGVEHGSLNIYLDLPLTIAEATLGTTVKIPTLEGHADVVVPPGSASGRKLRLRGHGIEDPKGQRGDLFAVVKVVVPDGRTLTPEQAESLRQLAATTELPRTGHGWTD